ncbi:unnamed protein product [Clavelina lepadiformis]|uniref:Uncharacterized protein n=1 Tax=Clavelina lepadiformis TaxID=159417 RepID=A0ABP0FXY3_CLALP
MPSNCFKQFLGTRLGLRHYFLLAPAPGELYATNWTSVTKLFQIFCAPAVIIWLSQIINVSGTHAFVFVFAGAASTMIYSPVSGVLLLSYQRGLFSLRAQCVQLDLLWSNLRCSEDEETEIIRTRDRVG